MTRPTLSIGTCEGSALHDPLLSALVPVKEAHCMTRPSLSIGTCEGSALHDPPYSQRCYL